MFRHWDWNRLVYRNDVRLRNPDVHWYVVWLRNWVVLGNVDDVRFRNLDNLWYGIRLRHWYRFVDVYHFRNMDDLGKK